MTVHSMRQIIHVYAIHYLALLRVVFIVIIVLVRFEFVQLVLVYDFKQHTVLFTHFQERNLLQLTTTEFENCNCD